MKSALNCLGTACNVSKFGGRNTAGGGPWVEGMRKQLLRLRCNFTV